MNGAELLNKMELVEPKYLAAADRAPKKKPRWLRVCAVAACLALVLGLTIPAMAAIPAVYEVLYTLSPATAQFFQPVALASEDNGIRMEVSAVYIHENTAEIYITMQDRTGDRLDETTDLFDSYQIHTPFHTTGHCDQAGYDPATKTATFLVTLEQWNKQNITGDKVTFSVGALLSHKQEFEGLLADVTLSDAALSPDTQGIGSRGSSGEKVDPVVLVPGEALSTPVEGVTVTGLGYVNGCLHVQTHYDDILNTDNHGYVTLVHRETGEVIQRESSISFFDSDGTGSYQDECFPEIPPETLGEYQLYGNFVTAPEAIKGNWSVTFPLEEAQP